MPITAPPPDWSKIKNKPTTISGYGITDSTASQFGISQGYVNMTGSRNLSTNYTNSTNKPRFVMIKLNAVNNIQATVDGELLPNGYGWTCFVVPPGKVYSAASGSGVERWEELG